MVQPLVKVKSVKKRTNPFKRHQCDRKIAVKVRPRRPAPTPRPAPPPPAPAHPPPAPPFPPAGELASAQGY